MTIIKESLGAGGLDSADAIALSAAFAAVKLSRRRPKRPAVQPGQGWADPTYGMMLATQAEREIVRLSRLAAEQRGV